MSVSHWLVGVHAPVQTEADAAAQKRSVWAAVCGEGTDDASGCAKLVRSPFGSIPVPWYVVQEIRSEHEGEPPTVTGRWSLAQVPVAQVGLCYYLFMLTWFAFTGLPRRASRRWHVLPLLAASIAAAVSIVYLCIMGLVLREWCKLCLILHGIDFLLLAGVIALWPRGRGSAPPGAADEGSERGLQTGHALAVLACAAALSAITFVHRSDQVRTAAVSVHLDRCMKQYETLRSDEAFLVSAFRGTPAETIPPRDSAPGAIFGQAPQFEVVVFSDLQCPHCRRFEERFKDEFVKLAGGNLRLTFRHFPLCTDCNPSQSRNIHPQACNAAHAAEAARLQGGQEAFWKMHDQVLAHQQELASNHFEVAVFGRWADEIGLDGDRLLAQLEDAQARGSVSADIEAGIALGIRGTPTVYIDGRRISHLQRDSAVFWKALGTMIPGPDSAKPGPSAGAPAAGG